MAHRTFQIDGADHLDARTRDQIVDVCQRMRRVRGYGPEEKIHQQFRIMVAYGPWEDRDEMLEIIHILLHNLADHNDVCLSDIVMAGIKCARTDLEKDIVRCMIEKMVIIVRDIVATTNFLLDNGMRDSIIRYTKRVIKNANPETTLRHIYRLILKNGSIKPVLEDQSIDWHLLTSKKLVSGKTLLMATLEFGKIYLIPVLQKRGFMLGPIDENLTYHPKMEIMYVPHMWNILMEEPEWIDVFANIEWVHEITENSSTIRFIEKWYGEIYRKKGQNDYFCQYIRAMPECFLKRHMESRLISNAAIELLDHVDQYRDLMKDHKIADQHRRYTGDNRRIKELEQELAYLRRHNNTHKLAIQNQLMHRRQKRAQLQDQIQDQIQQLLLETMPDLRRSQQLLTIVWNLVQEFL